MFGFSKTEKLEKIHKQIKDASLREVVERFADPEIIVSVGKSRAYLSKASQLDWAK